jgi:hypothetical protein
VIGELITEVETSNFIDVSSFDNGVYWIQYNIGNTILNEKVMISN